MSEYERLVQDRRDADRARHNDWKARALKAEADAERSKQLYYRSDDRAAKAEKALGEIAKIEIEFNGGRGSWSMLAQVFSIARAALEGK
jgi:hypothetical protein